MRQLDKIIFLLILVKVNELQSKPILGCSCAKDVPLVLNVPVAPPPLVVPCPTHGYKIEVPPPPALPAATPSYPLDLVVEAPVPCAPPSVCDPNLYTPIVAPAPLPAAPCGCAAPVLAPAPLPVAFPPPALAPCGCAVPAPPPVALPPLAFSPCGCAVPALPPAPCRYVSKDIESNIIYRGRSKREVATFKHKSMDEILDFVKSLKTTRVARKAKKPRLIKRDIKGEYDLLQREQSQMDLTIPEIIQYMPETMMPSFKRGKCNIGCKNCINTDDSNEKLKKKFNSGLPTEINNKENDQPFEQQEQPQKALNENPTESPNQHFDMSPQSAGENYFKRSVNTFQNQNPNPGYSGLLPPPYISSTMELTKLAQNPGNPIWYQPQPLTDTNVEYVYDRLGHKYKVKNGSFKLVTPSEQNDDEVNNRSAQVASVENTEETTTTRTTPTITDKAEDSSVPSASDQQMIDEEARKMFDSALQKHDFIDVNAPSSVDNADTMTQTPIVGAPSANQQKPTGDPHMDKIIRDIVYQHPDFIDASQHAPGALTLPEEVTRDETMHFLDKLIRGRLSKWFGEPSEEVPMHRLQDLNRYSRETGTSIKFIPVVTVDKDRLDKFRQTNSEDFSS